MIFSTIFVLIFLLNSFSKSKIKIRPPSIAGIGKILKIPIFNEISANRLKYERNPIEVACVVTWAIPTGPDKFCKPSP